MGRRFPGANPLASSVPGEFNKYQIYWINGTHNWEKPAGIAGDRILVHVWGAGGTGHRARRILQATSQKAVVVVD